MSSESERMWKLASRFMAVGIEMVAAVVLPSLLGSWLDDKFDTAPYCLYAGLVIGIGAAVRTVVRVAKHTHLDNL